MSAGPFRVNNWREPLRTERFTFLSGVPTKRVALTRLVGEGGTVVRSARPVLRLSWAPTPQTYVFQHRHIDGRARMSGLGNRSARHESQVHLSPFHASEDARGKVGEAALGPTSTRDREGRPCALGETAGRVMSADAIDRWLDVLGAAERSLTSPSTILRAARSGKLVGFKVNGNRCWRFRSSAVDFWLTSGSLEAQEQQHHLRIANR